MGNKIHPTAVISAEVNLGDGNIVGPGAVLIGPCDIGDDNWIGPYAVIGTPGQYHGKLHPESWSTGNGGQITIGSGNTIREFVTIQVSPATETKIGNGCYFMTESHVPHDALIEDDVKVACAALIGGYGHIGKGAYIGLGAILHQRLHVGAGSMVGMGAVVTTHVPPLSKTFGSPSRVRGFNYAKSDVFGFSESDKEIFQLAYSSGDFPESSHLSELAAQIMNSYALNIVRQNNGLSCNQ
jgi:UDP-N-acetylglucosamine acyltransferase